MTPHLYPVSPDTHAPPPPPRRNGEPWITEDYAAIIQACRDQEEPTIETVADAVGRTPNALRARIKSLLPLDRRGGTPDMVPGQLRTALLADEDYDWEGHVVATPPPRPVVEHVHPPAVLTGISGLKNDELLSVACAMAMLPRRERSVHARACAREVARRGLYDQLERSAQQDASDRVLNFVDDGYHSSHRSYYWDASFDPGPPEPPW